MAGAFSSFLVALMMPAFAQLQAANEPIDSDSITEITLERTPCLGTCPDYEVTLRKDGTAFYIGRDYAERRGRYTGAIAPAAFEQLAQFCVSHGFFELKSNRIVVFDAPTTIVIVRRGEEQHIVGEEGESLDRLKGFSAIYEEIDHVASSIQWISSDLKVHDSPELGKEDILRIAKTYAAGLGYEVARMNTRYDAHVGTEMLSPKLAGRKYRVVYFGPSRPQLGGDLFVFVDKKTGEVIDSIRGQ